MSISWNEIRTRAVAFSHDWAGVASESAEAKSFWDDFFNVFGVQRRRVAVYEQYVKSKGGDPGFIDLFWPGVMIAEHKSLGKNLDRAYSQALDYFPGIKDEDLPRYVIVSDFARFRIHDLEEGGSFEFLLSDLHSNVQRLGFIAGYEKREFKEQDPVNAKAADKLAKLHDAMRDSGYTGHRLEVYLVRILFCLFADDTGIFMPRGTFLDFIETCTREDGSDTGARLNELFDVLDTPEADRLKTRDERLLAFPHINGKLFEESLRSPAFDSKMREMLLACCQLGWGKISPAIFGSLFQGIMDAKARRNLGAHYTSEKNILKVIDPLFMDDLRAEFERIKRQPAKLKAFHEKIASLHFFDPACGCGNFLVISYRELRMLELEVIKRLYARELQQLSLDAVDQYVKVDVDQFHGIEIEEWPAQIAQVAMWLIDHQMNLLVGETFGQAVVRIPLVKSANIVHGNALRMDWNEVLPAERCSFVLGNPPFLGKKEQSSQQKADFQSVVGHIPGSGVLDFVAGWYVRAVEYLRSAPRAHNRLIQPRCAFVSTNSITQGEQVGVLWSWMLANRARIHFAHRTFKWSNEAKGNAAVHCVIVGFGLGETRNKTIYEYMDVRSEPFAVSASNINPYLVDAADLLLQRRSKPLCNVPPLVEGITPLDNGIFLFTEAEKKAFLEKEPDADRWFKPMLTGKGFINNKPNYCLWLSDATPQELRSMPYVMEKVAEVKRFRENSKSSQKFAATPWLYRETTIPERYILIPKTSSERRCFFPLGLVENVVVTNSTLYMDGGGEYEFGVLCSTMHNAWVRNVGGRLKSDFRYSKDIVYNNFPWPVDATDKQREAVSSAAQGVLDARATFPESTLADLYDPRTMPPALIKAHQALDRAVDAAYVPSGGKRKWNSDAERVAFLFQLYSKLTSLLPETSRRRRR